MNTIEAQFKLVKRKIEEAAQKAHRSTDEIELIAVTKTVEVERIRPLIEAGHLSLGENRVQELLSKKDLLPSETQWHLIGQLQSNKIRKILPSVKAIHSVDSFKLAKDINRIAGELGVVVRIFLEVNVGEENSKIGFNINDLENQFQQILELPHLEILGLMCIPPPCEEGSTNRPYFAQLRDLRDRLANLHQISMPYLSMGMSDDFEDAILEGATHVRVGSAIFGSRH